MSDEREIAAARAWHTMDLWERYRQRLDRLHDPQVPLSEEDRRCIDLMLTCHRLFRLMAYEEMVQRDPVVPDEMFGEMWQVHDHQRWPMNALLSEQPEVAAALNALAGAIRYAASKKSATSPDDDGVATNDHLM